MFLSPNSSVTGGKAGRGSFAAGTTMLFIQAAAPVGWTRVTTNDDALLRIVGSAAPGTGGSNGFVASFNSQTTVGSTTLSTAQIPSHNHNFLQAQNCTAASGIQVTGSTTVTNSTIIQNAGGGGSHNHTITTAIKYVDALVAKKN
jgi:hypothetical protein